MYTRTPCDNFSLLKTVLVWAGGCPRWVPLPIPTDEREVAQWIACYSVILWYTCYTTVHVILWYMGYYGTDPCPATSLSGIWHHIAIVLVFMFVSNLSSMFIDIYSHYLSVFSFFNVERASQSQQDSILSTRRWYQ